MAVTVTGTYVTRAGYMLLTKLLAAQGELHFTRAAVGTGKVPGGYSPENLTGLVQYKMDAEIASYGLESEKAYVIAQISSEKVNEGFLVTEVGVFATDPDEGEILYGYMDISEDPTYIYSNASGSMAKFAEFQMYFLIGALQKVTTIITPGSYVSREKLKEGLDTKVTADGGEAGKTVVGFDDSGTMAGVTSLPTALVKIVTGNSLAKTLQALVAGMKFVLHLGMLVDNCVTDNPQLPLSARQGKVLMDAVNVLNANGEYELIGYLSTPGQNFTLVGHQYRYIYAEVTADGNNTKVIASKVIPVSVLKRRSTATTLLIDGTRAAQAITYSCGAVLEVSDKMISLGSVYSNGWNFYNVQCYGIK